MSLDICKLLFPTKAHNLSLQKKTLNTCSCRGNWKMWLANNWQISNCSISGKISVSLLKKLSNVFSDFLKILMNISLESLILLKHFRYSRNSFVKIQFLNLNLLPTKCTFFLVILPGRLFSKSQKWIESDFSTYWISFCASLTQKIWFSRLLVKTLSSLGHRISMPQIFLFLLRTFLLAIRLLANEYSSRISGIHDEFFWIHSSKSHLFAEEFDLLI